MENVTCKVSGKQVAQADARKGEEIQDQLFELIREDHPDFTKDSFISIAQLTLYRKKYLASLVTAEFGD
ncbi:MAG TPA: hypothetical protein VFU15_01715, partial [Bacteroidia bacterium]|nr:hypothetical protein [Bacteroidia bacterium]